MQDDRNEANDRANSAAEMAIEITALRSRIKYLKKQIAKENPPPDLYKKTVANMRRFRKKHPLQYKIDGGSYNADGSRRCDYEGCAPYKKHGMATQSKGGYEICQHCYDGIIAAEKEEEEAYRKVAQ